MATSTRAKRCSVTDLRAICRTPSSRSWEWRPMGSRLPTRTTPGCSMWSVSTLVRQTPLQSLHAGFKLRARTTRTMNEIMCYRLQTVTRMEKAVDTFCRQMGDQFEPCCAAYMEVAPASVMTLGAVGLQVWKTAAESTCSAGLPGQEEMDAAVQSPTEHSKSFPGSCPKPTHSKSRTRKSKPRSRKP